MQDLSFPTVVNVTDLRYRWAEVNKELQENEWPVLVVDYSTPTAIIFPYKTGKNLLTQSYKQQSDPLIAWRKKYAQSFSGFDAAKTVRQARNTRWNMS